MLKRLVFGGVYGGAALWLFVYRDALVAWIDSDTAWHQDILIGLAGLIVAIVPAVPYGVIAAVFGAKYGAAAGSLINLTISSLAAIILFAWIRYTFTEESRLKAARLKGIRRLTDYAERNAFFAVLFARLLPIVPAQLVNAYAAIIRMKGRTFIAATIVGKIPYLIAVTLLGESLFERSGWREILLILALYLLFISVVFLLGKRFAIPSTDAGGRHADAAGDSVNSKKTNPDYDTRIVLATQHPVPDQTGLENRCSAKRASRRNH